MRDDPLLKIDANVDQDGSPLRVRDDPPLKIDANVDQDGSPLRVRDDPPFRYLAVNRGQHFVDQQLEHIHLGKINAIEHERIHPQVNKPAHLIDYLGWRADKAKILRVLTGKPVAGQRFGLRLAGRAGAAAASGLPQSGRIAAQFPTGLIDYGQTYAGKVQPRSTKHSTYRQTWLPGAAFWA
jgi:hypothetical protein